MIQPAYKTRSYSSPHASKKELEIEHELETGHDEIEHNEEVEVGIDIETGNEIEHPYEEEVSYDIEAENELETGFETETAGELEVGGEIEGGAGIEVDGDIEDEEVEEEEPWTPDNGQEFGSFGGVGYDSSGYPELTAGKAMPKNYGMPSSPFAKKDASPFSGGKFGGFPSAPFGGSGKDSGDDNSGGIGGFGGGIGGFGGGFGSSGCVSAGSCVHHAHLSAKRPF